uniref:Epithelial stromal interaction 1 n=1 Tax=Salvator merianae TaxID=96440 RepID=A0A8D0EEK9_SALMN
MESKYQQKLKKEEYRRKKRESEDAATWEKKMIQREKAKKLEEKQQKQEWQRQQMFADDHYLKTIELLNSLDLGPSSGISCKANHCKPESTAWARSRSYKQIQREEENRKLQEMKDAQRRKAELLELKQRKEEKIRIKALQKEQQRVNNAFLDKLQNSHQLGDMYQSGCLGNTDFSADSWEVEYE